MRNWRPSSRAEGQKYFQDPWQARNAYIDVILDRGNGVLEDFFSRQGVPNLREDDRVAALKLLEMQRHSLLMYTSCGWFFADISGLESLQVIKYAARALQLGQDFTAEPLEAPFLKILERAVSNIPKEGNGLTIYQKRIKPAVVDYPKVANQWVISWLKDRERQCPHHIYHYRAEPMDLEEKTQGSLLFASGRLTPDFGHHPGEPEPGVFHRVLGKLSLPHPGAAPPVRPRSSSPCGMNSSGSWRRPRRT